MKEKLLQFGSYVLVAALATVVTLAMVQMEVGLKPSKLDQLENLIEERFVEDADMAALEDAAASAMIKATGDRWSYYMSAEEYESYLDQVDNSYVGVGITIQHEEGEGYRILEVVSGGPAEEEGGIQVKDLLIAVENTDVRAMTVTEVGDLVKGKEGT